MGESSEGQWIQIALESGQSVRGWRKEASNPRGTLIIVQEIYGVNAHIRRVCADYAADGFTTIAPCFFDLVETGIELGYSDEDTQRGRELVAALGMDNAMRIVGATRHAQAATESVAVIGYCWGGAVAFLSATRLGIPAISYYGRLVEQFVHERPQAPLQFHFGQRDPLIPMTSVERTARHFPTVPLYTYDAGHAFNRLEDAHGDPDAAALAKRRSLSFLNESLKGS